MSFVACWYQIEQIHHYFIRILMEGIFQWTELLLLQSANMVCKYFLSFTSQIYGRPFQYWLESHTIVQYALIDVIEYCWECLHPFQYYADHLRTFQLQPRCFQFLRSILWRFETDLAANEILHFRHPITVGEWCKHLFHSILEPFKLSFRFGDQPIQE